MKTGYMSVKALAAYSGLSERTLRSYLVHPSTPLPHFRVGARVLVDTSDFDTWMLKFKVATKSSVDAIVADVLAGL